MVFEALKLRIRVEYAKFVSLTKGYIYINYGREYEHTKRT